MNSYKPGPWHVDPKAAEESFFEDVSILRQDGLAVAVAVHNGDILPPEPEANALLIAAAPDLLEALKLFVRAEKMARDGNPPQDADKLIDLGDAAIAKAEGRS